MKIIDGQAVFSTGKIMYANLGIIGLSPELDVYQGYDGYFDVHKNDWDDDEPVLTKTEKIELADYMIAEWQKFKEAEKLIEDGA